MSNYNSRTIAIRDAKIAELQTRLGELEAALACADGGLAAEAFLVLDLIVAEFESDPTSLQCFDRLTVERAKTVIREHKRLGRGSKLEDWKRLQELEAIERRYLAMCEHGWYVKWFEGEWLCADEDLVRGSGPSPAAALDAALLKLKSK